LEVRILFFVFSLFFLSIFVEETVILIPCSGLGISATTSGRVETVAMYGGVQFALGIFYAWASMKEERYVEGLRSIVVVLGGMSSSRLFALSFNGFAAAAGPYG
jgi:hypothetical protein